MALDGRRQQVWAMFSVELEERIQALSALLLRLERGQEDDRARRETFDELFREAHSLKGAARAVEFGAVEQVAHALEEMLEAARSANARPAPGWLATASRAVEALEALSRLHAESGSPPPELADVLAALRAQRPTADPGDLPVAAAPPAPAPGPIRVAQPP